MATADDVAAYILQQRTVMDSVKLQKLLYYSQAWHLVAMDAPLFDDAITAFAYGPVVRSVWKKHEGDVVIKRRDAHGNPDALTEDQREVVDAVIEAYRRIPTFDLAELTHAEAPWADAWSRRYDHGITPEAMRDYYAAEAAKPRKSRTTPRVPRIPHAKVTYVDSDEMAEITDMLDRPEVARGLLAAVTRNRK